MSDMKCPVCNKGTVKEFETAPYFVCSNEFCPSYSETDTTEYDILIRTRKALDVAVDALRKIGFGKNINIIPDDESAKYINLSVEALDQIQELEKGE